MQGKERECVESHEKTFRDYGPFETTFSLLFLGSSLLPRERVTDAHLQDCPRLLWGLERVHPRCPVSLALDSLHLERGLASAGVG